MQAAQDSLFAQRVRRLEAASKELRGLYIDWANTKSSEIQQKANTYLASSAPSHGEKQGQATAHVAHLTSEAQETKGRIEALEEEIAFLKFCIEYIGEGE